MPLRKQPPGIRAINQLRLLNILRQYPGLSRTAVSRQTGLGKATISSLVADCIDKGLIREVGVDRRAASTGRRPVRLELNPAAYFAVGIHLTGDECIAVLTHLDGTPAQVLQYPMPLTSVEASLDCVARAVADLTHDRAGVRILGVGVGIPGIVDAARQKVILAENVGWTDVPFAARLAERIGRPVTLIRRSNAGALGEFWLGSGQRVSNLIYVSISVGIGAGTIIDGSLYEGENGSAGEVGHVTVDPKGPPCICGNAGCLETLASTRAIAVLAKQRIKEGVRSVLVEWTDRNLELITGHLVIKAAATGDDLALGILREAATYLGIALANMINLFNPALVIIDGEVLEVGELFMEPLRRSINRRAFAIPLAAARIVPSQLRHQAAAIGAASLVIDSVFMGPNPGALLGWDGVSLAAMDGNAAGTPAAG